MAEEITTEQQALDDLAEKLANDIHESLSDNLIFISDAIDNFFVDERIDDEGSHSRLIVSYLVDVADLDSIHSEYLLKLRLHLPKTQNKLRLVVESSVNFEDSDQIEDAVNLREVSENAEYSTALQFVFTESKYWQLSSNAGVRFSDPPNPFVRLRLRRLFFLGKWESRFTQTVFWFSEEGVGEVSSLDFERTLNKNFFFRSTSKATIAEEEEGIATGNQNFSLFQKRSVKRGFVYSVGVNGVFDDHSYIEKYYLNVRFRHNFYKKWAFYEVIPGYDFPRENNFSKKPFFIIKLDVVIGKV